MYESYEIQVFHSPECPACTEQLRLLRRWSTFIPIRLVNVDKLPAYEKAANIEATPTTVLIRQGAEVRRWVGIVTPASIVAHLV